ncbi:MAG TPA: acyltransferase [Casimicrobiaceae bacterium]
MTFDAVAHGRENNLNLLRMVAASMVLFSHSYALTGHIADEPLGVLSGGYTDVATIGVVVFFGISGFLIAQSLARAASLYRYAVGRALRIVPGLLLAKLFCVVVIGWLATTLASGAYWRHADTWRFLVATPFFGVRDRLPGVFATLPYPLAVNGSLWTIPVEVWCYCIAALIAAGTIMRRGWLYAALSLAALAGYATFPQIAKEWMPSDGYGTIPGLILSFFAGAWLHAARRVIPVSLPVAAVAALLTILAGRVPTIAGFWYYVCIPYVALVLAYHPRLLWRAYLRVGDYSYGTYLLAFPVQQFLIWQLGLAQPLALFALALLVTVPLAMLSWHNVEGPALALKDRVAAYRPRVRGAAGKSG